MRWGLRAMRSSKACSKKALSRASSLWAWAAAGAGAAAWAITAGAAAQSARTAADEIRRRRMRKTPLGTIRGALFREAWPGASREGAFLLPMGEGGPIGPDEGPRRPSA